MVGIFLPRRAKISCRQNPPKKLAKLQSELLGEAKPLSNHNMYTVVPSYYFKVRVVFIGDRQGHIKAVIQLNCSLV
jgi:hypothetical protein